jgi:hypothetical protein
VALAGAWGGTSARACGGIDDVSTRALTGTTCWRGCIGACIGEVPRGGNVNGASSARGGNPGGPYEKRRKLFLTLTRGTRWKNLFLLTEYLLPQCFPSTVRGIYAHTPPLIHCIVDVLISGVVFYTTVTFGCLAPWNNGATRSANALRRDKRYCLHVFVYMCLFQSGGIPLGLDYIYV